MRKFLQQAGAGIRRLSLSLSLSVYVCEKDNSKVGSGSKRLSIKFSSWMDGWTAFDNENTGSCWTCSMFWICVDPEHPFGGIVSTECPSS